MTNIFLNDSEDIIDIRIDGVFKAVFTKDTPTAKGALSGLVSALVCRELTIISILNNEPPISNIGDRQLRFDINCRAKDGELVNVEMCFNPKPFEPRRLEFYVAKLFTAQDIKGTGKGYLDLKQTYQIAILAKEHFFNDEEFFHTFEYYDPKHLISLNGLSKIITLELPKLDTIVKKPASQMNIPERWGVYLEYLTDKSKRSKINEIVELEEGIAMASEVLLTISRDEEERARIMRAEKTELDYISYMAWAKEQGHAEGRAEGRVEGIGIGEQKIIDLLKNGKSPEEIIREYGSK